MPHERARFVSLSGSHPLLEQFRDPLEQALLARHSRYSVRIETVGWVGEVLVSVTGTKGRLPMLFGSEDLEPGYVTRVVADTVARFGF